MTKLELHLDFGYGIRSLEDILENFPSTIHAQPIGQPKYIPFYQQMAKDPETLRGFDYEEELLKIQQQMN